MEEFRSRRLMRKVTRKLLHEMMEKGVNYIDSARGYTVSEQYIGYAGGIRDKFVLATKSMSRTKKQWQRILRQVLEISAQTISTFIRYTTQAWNSFQVIGEGGALEALMEAEGSGQDRTYRTDCTFYRGF